MNDDLHNNDNLFKQAYKKFEENPSSGVWEKLTAALDKKDANYYKVLSKKWKLIAAMLFMLLSSAIIYEYFSGHTQKALVANKENKQPDTIMANQYFKQNIQEKITAENSNVYDNKAKSNKTKNITLKNSLNKMFNKDFLQTATSNLPEGKQFNFAQQKSALQTTKNISDAFSNTDINTSNLSTQKTVLPVNRQHENESYYSGKKLNKIAAPDSLINNITTNQTNNIANKNQTLKNEIISIKQGNKIKQSRWTVIPFVAAEMAEQKLNDDVYNNNGQNGEANEIHNRENEELSFSTGALLHYTLKKNFSLTSGLIYARYEMSVQPQTLYAKLQNNKTAYKLNTSNGYAYVSNIFGQTPQAGDSIYTDFSDYSLNYLQLPLLAGYTINLGNKLSITPNIGATANIFLSSRFETELNNAQQRENISVHKFQGVKHISFSLLADAELRYQLSNRTGIVLLPIFKTALSSATKNNVVKTYPYSIGIGAGLSVNLGK